MGAVRPLVIVEVDPSTNPVPSVTSTREGVQVDALVFEGSPKPLNKDVVEEAPLAVHGDADPGLLQAVRPRPRRELAALVGIEDIRTAITGQSVLQRIDTELNIHGVR